MIAYLLVVLCVASASLVSADRGHVRRNPSPPMPGDETWNVCWRDAYNRGLGHLPNQCNDTYELSLGLCFKPCEADYTGFGSECWSNCPEGFLDYGTSCVVPGETYLPCPWYDVCGLAHKDCQNNCTDGFQWSRCTCTKPGQVLTKKHYGRGVGEFPECFSNETWSFGSCYPTCKENYLGDGPSCWENGTASTTFTLQCSPVAYGAAQSDCDQLNSFLLLSGISPPCLESTGLAFNTGDLSLVPLLCQPPVALVLHALGNVTSVC